jgi:hypothetical protein
MIYLPRRRALQAGAAASGAILLGCGDDSTPLGDAGPGTRDTGMTGQDSGTDAPDVTALNALLAAEYAAVKAYDAGAAILMAPPPMDPLASIAPVALAVAGRFQQQHRDHAEELADAIAAARGTPVDEASVTFTPPAGFSPGVLNVLKLACNAEKAASIAYNDAVQVLTQHANRVLASAIEGDETQHFIVLYAILKGVAAPGPMVMMVDKVVPTSFVTTIDDKPGLETVPALVFTA